MFLVLTEDQIIRLKKEAFQHTETVTAPGYEVGYVITGEEGARLCGWQEMHVAQLGKVRRHTRSSDLAPLDIFHGVFTNIVRVL